MTKGNLNNEEKKILDYLKNNEKECPNMKDISKALNMSYPTVLKRIEILERFNLIKIITIGNNKVCRVNEKNV